jgi:TMEM151 family
MASPADATESSHTTDHCEFDEEHPSLNSRGTKATVDLDGNPIEGRRKCDVGNDRDDENKAQDEDYVDEDDDGPVDGVGCQRGCARDRHMVLTLLSVGLVLVPILMAAKAISFPVFIVIESILGALYLFFVLRSNTFQYLLNMNTTETVMDYMNHMYRAEPVVRWFIQCYHYEQRSRQVATPGPNGTTIYRTEYYQERVNTHSAHGQLVITGWTDVSTPLDQKEIEVYNMTKISVKKSWFGDAGADEQRRSFIRINKRDAHHDFYETLDLAGYRSRFLGFVDLNNVPVLAHWGWYLVSHLTVVFGVPYRMWLSSKSHKVRTTIVKQVWTT